MLKKYIYLILILSFFCLLNATSLIAQSVKALTTDTKNISSTKTNTNDLTNAPLDGGVSILLILGLLGGLIIINDYKVKKKAKSTSEN